MLQQPGLTQCNQQINGDLTLTVAICESCTDTCDTGGSDNQPNTLVYGTWVEDESVGSTQFWRSITSSSDGAKLAAVAYEGNIWTFASAPTTCAYKDPANGGPGTGEGSCEAVSTMQPKDFCKPVCDEGYDLSGATECSEDALLTLSTCNTTAADATEELSAAAEEKTAVAVESRDALLAAITDETLKAKAKLFADAAIAGVNVKKVKVALPAASEDAACSQAFTKMKLAPGDGLLCDVAVSSRRRLAQSTYDVTVFVSPVVVDDATFNAAVASLEAVDIVVTKTEVNPTTELRNIPGVNSALLASFEEDAEEAAEATTALNAHLATVTPHPPPSPPSPPLSPPPPSPPEASRVERLRFSGDPRGTRYRDERSRDRGVRRVRGGARRRGVTQSVFLSFRR